ncbi:MAG: FG-GAP repeat domain-containing protein [Woeseiaceae bacterium]
MKRNSLYGYSQRELTLVWVALVLCFATGNTNAAGCEAAANTVTDIPLVCFDRELYLDTEATTSANASVGDLNGDGSLDIVLIKGRHWPVTNQYLLGDGSGNFDAAEDLGDVADRSYTGALADLDRDGDLDIVVSNDNPDRSLVYLNAGDGRFSEGSTFGQPQWNTRNVSATDINDDMLPDIIVANRGPLEGPSPNYICLNLGDGRFQTDCRQFSDESATTITPYDVNGDDLMDLVVPHRDGGQSHIYLGQSREGNRFEAKPFGPPQSAIRATAVVDFDQDGEVDIVAIHTGNSEGGDGVVDRGRNFRGSTIFYGLGDNRFSEAYVIDDSSRMPYALAISDLNQDGAMDILVGYVEAPTTVFLNRRSDRQFHNFDLSDNEGTTYGFAVGDLDDDGQSDIVVAKSGARNRVFFGSQE